MTIGHALTGQRSTNYSLTNVLTFLVVERAISVFGSRAVHSKSRQDVPVPHGTLRSPRYSSMASSPLRAMMSPPTLSMNTTYYTLIQNGSLTRSSTKLRSSVTSLHRQISDSTVLVKSSNVGRYQISFDNRARMTQLVFNRRGREKWLRLPALTERPC